jgi:hypothetical protein
MTAPIYRPFVKNQQTLIEVMLNDFAKQFQTCIPAIVKEVVSRDTVKVSPAVQLTDSEGNPVDWANITTTVLTPFSSGLFISMPLSVGDTGWLVAADMDTSGFKETKQPAQQKVYSRHLYQYGFFVPDAINGYTVSDDDSGAIVLSNTNGTTKITIKDDDITIKSSNTLKINANSVNISSDGNANVTIDGLNFKSHKHLVSGITAGSGSVTSGGAQ